jgi:hypothetical protein
MKRLSTNHIGFTISEAAIACSVLLAFGIIATPALYATVMVSAVRIKALSNARNLGMALKTFANDHEGKFPEGNTAADAFSKLLKVDPKTGSYISDKKQFLIKDSKYTPKMRSIGFFENLMIAFGLIEDPENNLQGDPIRLHDGENHWAYMSQLDDNGHSRWPLIFDGPASPDGKYSTNKGEKGGIYEGKVAIAVRLDGSANAEQLKHLFISTDEQDNILQPTKTWAIGGKLLMPY